MSKSLLAIFIGACALVAVLSFGFEVHSAKASVEKYVGIWEDDIAQAKIFQGDPSLQNKILEQLKEVHTAVAQTEVQSPEKLQCRIFTDVPITYNSLPSGSMRVCFSSADLALKALLSPLFMLGIVLGMIFIGFSLRREFQNQLHEQKLAAELALNKEIASVSRQVAHDIRGPLMALTTLSQLSHEMGSDKRELLNLAVARIRGIADDLLNKGQKEKSTVSSMRTSQETDLTQLLESLLKEYRFANPKVNFTWHKHIHSENVPVTLEALKVQRVVSNLINNSLEALPEKEASINITLMERPEHWLLQIMDNGSGIPEDILPSLAQEGVSHGKENGHGLGLYDARKTVESVGGELQIRSRVGVGTQVVLLFPKLNKEIAKNHAAL
ncbi:HAMP domain-containing sensor histidine kinase [Bdellovibrio sp. 22V]|uniref:sensor histidine kinase n=1 Tax=Bdellovibrio sp. 22V TaxID=3044166 RepID=UPI002542EA91|nr:HAMP domain-containing sensor histidine kinase [Bdellovibrio sp. 22V]WII71382.1 HAMP domain-containing sensor histidine kinase [Bdellovibrio sp. 22V]